MNVAAAVLAAGASRRLGTPKQLLRWADGVSLVRRSAEAVLRSQAARGAVIVGDRAAEVVADLEGLAVDVLNSEDPSEGIAASIRAASSWAKQTQAGALLLCVCDQPALSARHLNALLDAWREQQSLVASCYAQKRGVPAVFPARYFDALSALRGDTGAAGILKAASHITLVEWPEGEQDVDTPRDWERARAVSTVD